MSNTEKITAPKKWDGERLDRVLQQMSQLSRKKVKSLLDAGKILINNKKVVIASWVVKAGDIVEIRATDPEKRDAKEYFLKIVYEDDFILVIEKPAGISCEEAPHDIKPSLVSIINAYFKKSRPHLSHHYLGLAHRLDRETSGVMVYSKSRDANKIIEQFKNHRIQRRYLAIVSGRIAGESGKIDIPLEKTELLPRGQKVKVSKGSAGKPALTQFRVLERYEKATLVDVELNTGRTHQIRVHFNFKGHPVIGDKNYGPQKPEIRFPRQALHAYFLGFHHPITGKKMSFELELPKDLKKLVKNLQERA